jgi:ABC-type proline/glycine betaine transport system permease subunit
LFQTEILLGAVLAVALAFVVDAVLLVVQRAMTPWATDRRAEDVS